MSTLYKIVPFEVLAQTTTRSRMEGLSIVHCHGCFDLLHIGHIRHLGAAKQLADILVVTVTPDRFINKGPGRPAFSGRLRAEAIAALACVNFVSINQWATAVETIAALQPSFYVKGSEYRGNMTPALEREKEAVEAVGGKLVFTDEIIFSSTTLINRFMPTDYTI